MRMAAAARPRGRGRDRAGAAGGGGEGHGGPHRGRGGGPGGRGGTREERQGEPPVGQVGPEAAEVRHLPPAVPAGGLVRLDAPRGGLSALAVEHVEHVVPDCFAVHHVSLFLHALGTGTAASPRMPCRSSRIRICPSPRYRRVFTVEGGTSPVPAISGHVRPCYSL